MKVCTRCGRELPEEEFYLVKYKGKEPKYRQSICKDCAKIEQKRRYLIEYDPENPLLESIERLYAKHAAAGRNVPGATRERGAVDDLVERMLND